jgi:hypothetical protein
MAIPMPTSTLQLIDPACVGEMDQSEKLNYIYAAAWYMSTGNSASTLPLPDPACIGAYGQDQKLTEIYNALWNFAQSGGGGGGGGNDLGTPLTLAQLDAIPTAGQNLVGNVRLVIDNSNVTGFWSLTSGTFPGGANASQPNDYNASTNQVYWARTI